MNVEWMRINAGAGLCFLSFAEIMSFTIEAGENEMKKNTTKVNFAAQPQVQKQLASSGFEKTKKSNEFRLPCAETAGGAEHKSGKIEEFHLRSVDVVHRFGKRSGRT